MLRHNAAMASSSHSLKGPRSRGRPRIHREPWTRVSFVLFDRHLAVLDHFSAAAATDGARELSRVDIVRAFVEALSKSRLRAVAGSSPEDLALLLTEKLSAAGEVAASKGHPRRRR